jgi:hypothetical protein
MLFGAFACTTSTLVAQKPEDLTILLTSWKLSSSTSSFVRWIGLVFVLRGSCTQTSLSHRNAADPMALLSTRDGRACRPLTSHFILGPTFSKPQVHLEQKVNALLSENEHRETGHNEN